MKTKNGNGNEIGGIFKYGPNSNKFSDLVNIMAEPLVHVANSISSLFVIFKLLKTLPVWTELIL